MLSYPCRDENANLAKMIKLKEIFPEIPVGYSDHTRGTLIPLAAVALGARSIEKHYTVDKSLPDSPDHGLSLSADELPAFMNDIKRIESSVGTFINGHYPSEDKAYSLARKSIVARNAIKKGTVISADMLTVKRPGTGIYPRFMDIVIGRTAIVDIPEDEVITWKMI